MHRIAVVNRGDAAVRFVQAVREYNSEHGAALRTVAFYTDPDRDSAFVRRADESHGLGPAMYTDPESGRRLHTYVDLELLRRALIDRDIDTVWVGWGFVSENPDFAQLCEQLEIRFVGPSAQTMRLLGSKIDAKALAESVDVPVVPWGGPVAGEDEAISLVERIGYPVLIKASAGGGGRGIRFAASSHELAAALRSAAEEARSAFGDPAVLIERAVARARHIEVQVAGDSHGQVWAIGVRDCTVQRRRQKIIEEATTADLDPALVERVKAYAERLVRAAKYLGVGTVEFLHDIDSDEIYFMEVNARLQVEHTVTEASTGLDLVKLQIELARGGALEGNPPEERFAAIEARITAEDVFDGFRPAPGRVVKLALPSGPGVRVDTGLSEGDVIPSDFDPLLAKVIATGRNRSEAVSRLRRAIGELEIVVENGAATIGFVTHLLAHPLFLDRRIHVAWVDEMVEQGLSLAQDDSQIALLVAAIELAEMDRQSDSARLRSTAARGRPDLVGAVPRPVELVMRGSSHHFVVYRCGPTHFAIETDAGLVDVTLRSAGEIGRIGEVGGRAIGATVLAMADGVQVDLVGSSYHCRSEQAGIVRVASPAVVVAVLVVEGQTVAAGEVVAVVESMKLETPLLAPAAGVVRSIPVIPNSQVDAGAAIVHLELDSDGDSTGSGGVDFSSIVGENHRSGVEDLDAMEIARRLLHGFVVPRLAEFGAMDIGPIDRRSLEVLDMFALCLSATSPVRRPGDRIGTALPSAREILFQFLRAPERSRSTLPTEVLDELDGVVRRYGASAGLEAGTQLDEAIYRLVCAQKALSTVEPLVVTILRRMLTDPMVLAGAQPSEEALTFIADVSQGTHLAVSDSARALADHLYVLPRFDHLIEAEDRRVERDIREILDAEEGQIPDRLASSMTDVPSMLWRAGAHETVPTRALEVVLRRLYRSFPLNSVVAVTGLGVPAIAGRLSDDGTTSVTAFLGCPADTSELRRVVPAGSIVEIVVPAGVRRPSPNVLTNLFGHLDVARVTVTSWDDSSGIPSVSTDWRSTAPESCSIAPAMHPVEAARLELWRLREFEVEHLERGRSHHLFRLRARENPGDVRFFVIGDVMAGHGGEADVELLERALLEAFAMIRGHLAHVSERERPGHNRVVLHARGDWRIPSAVIGDVLRRFAPVTRSLSLDRIILRTSEPSTGDGRPAERVLHITGPASVGMSMGFSAPSSNAIRPLSPRQQRVQKLRSRGLRDPFELVDLLVAKDAEFSDFPSGKFQEFDLDASGTLVPVDREPGMNEAAVVVGIIENRTSKHPEGMRRVAMLSDSSHGLGALAEAECARIVAALELAEAEGLPVEWFTVSAGAKISMSSGTENLDWVARALRRIIDFTQTGGEINVIVCGVNVGAQPYFNAEATMLMHTRGILVMTPQSSLVLTGKEALDFAGGVSADDNVGIGGYDRVMGPNGQAQYWAPTIEAACETLFGHYEHCYVAPGERAPRVRPTIDPADRDVCHSPHPTAPWTDFTTVGDVFSEHRNPDRKKPFDIRSVMDALRDADASILERWGGMHGAESSVVWDAHVGGFPVTLLGVESHPLPRTGIVPSDGPEAWSAATLFPLSSKKLARAINSASGSRPVVILANLAGFDGSPESLRKLQLEYGAEIGRAIKNFVGPIVFTVISRYHGGAFVVFSKALNDQMTVLAVEGAKASVIGGSAAAAVVFTRDVAERVSLHPDLLAHQEQWRQSDPEERLVLDARRDDLVERVRAELRGEVAREFDAVHTVERALSVGSIDRIVEPSRLRPEIIGAVASWWAGTPTAPVSDIDIEVED